MNFFEGRLESETKIKKVLQEHSARNDSTCPLSSKAGFRKTRLNVPFSIRVMGFENESFR